MGFDVRFRLSHGGQVAILKVLLVIRVVRFVIRRRTGLIIVPVRSVILREAGIEEWESSMVNASLDSYSKNVREGVKSRDTLPVLVEGEI